MVGSRTARARATALLRDAGRALDRAPTVSTPVVMARATAFLYLTADVFCGAAMLSQWHLVARPWAAAASVAATAAVGVLVWRRGRRWRPAAYHALVVAGTALVTASVVLSPGGATAVALSSVYALEAVLASFLFRFRLALAHVAVMLAACAGAFAVTGGVSVAESLLVSGEIVIASWVAGWLTRVAADSEVDALCGLPNRRGLDRQLAAGTAAAAERGGLVLAVIDLDFFKAVNDTAGHAEGDRVLREAAAAWQGVLGRRHVLARLGGDEFALLLHEVDRAGAEEVAERLRSALGELTCTIGLARWEQGDSPSMLLSRADAALYTGKRAGRDRVTWHESDTGALSEPLHAALLAGDLQVHYQPIVDLGSGELEGVEALVRWPDGAGGWHAPDTFIPTAEATGLIRPLGEWVLHQACADAQEWRRAGLVLEKLSVNVSPLQLQEPGFPAVVRRVLAETGLDATALVLEVTESTLGVEGGRSAQLLAELRREGVRVAIDDFGTGYSTLSRLRDVPVDVLKIDRAFVSTLGQERSHAPIVAAVVAMAGALGMRTVAEGVETPEQAVLLRAMGCTSAQGFLYSRAVPAQVLLERWRPSVPAGAAAGALETATARRP